MTRDGTSHKRRIVVGRKPYRGPNYSLRIAVVTVLFVLGLIASVVRSCSPDCAGLPTRCPISQVTR